MNEEEEWEEEGKWRTAVQAFFVLAFFFLAVAFGADLQFTRAPVAAASVVSLVPAPAPLAPKIEPPKPEPEPEPASLPDPEIERAAEIALEKERERKKREEEEKKRKEEEKKRKEKEEREKKKREEEKKRKEEEQKKREEEEKKRKEEERAARQAAAAAAQRAAVLDNLRSGYIGRIIGSIEPYLITPPEARGEENLLVIVAVNLAPDGTLLGFPEIAEPSGVPEYDEAALRAVLQASPLPMPKDPELIEEFQTLRLHIRPE